MWRSEDDLSELILSSHYMGPKGQIQVIGLGGKLILCE